LTGFEDEGFVENEGALGAAGGKIVGKDWLGDAVAGEGFGEFGRAEDAIGDEEGVGA
jgi:hypothetical protein